MNWEQWAADTAGNYFRARTAAEYERPYDLQAMKMQLMAQNGTLYTEGQPLGMPGGSMGLLLLGLGAVALIMLVKA